MSSEPHSRPLLFFPPENLLGILREFHVVWRIRVDKILRLQRHLFKIAAHKVPALQSFGIGAEITAIIDSCVTPKRNIKLPGPVEAAQAIETRSVQIIKQ